MKKIISVILAVIVVLSVPGSMVPARAAKEKTVTVKTKKALLAEINKSDEETIIYKSSKKESVKLTGYNSEYKKLVIDAPKTAFECVSCFDSITLKAAKSFRESDTYDTCYTIKGDNIKFTVGKEKGYARVERLYIEGKNATIILKENAGIGLLNCNKKSAKVTVKADRNSEAEIYLNKKTDLVLKGISPRSIVVHSKSKGSRIKTGVPIELSAEKDLKLELKKGSEGSSVSAGREGITIKIRNDSGEAAALEGKADFILSGKYKQETEERTDPQEKSEDKTNRESDTETTDEEEADTLGSEEDDNVPEGVFLSRSRYTDINGRNGENDYSYLYNEEGYFWRVEVDNFSEESPEAVYIEKYDSSFDQKDHTELRVDEGWYWKGFFNGKKYNFMIIGQNNDAENDDQPVFRVVRYDKNWNRTGSVDLKGANTTIPSRAGSLRCAEEDGYLFIHTCHQRYRTPDGLRHQSNMSFSVDEENMTIPYAGYMFQPGYVSHSFDQYVLINDKGQVVTLDHGDAYPRSVVLNVMDLNNGVLSDENRKTCTILPIKGETGDNTTGASLGGLEEVDDGYVMAFNYDEEGGRGAGLIRNMYIGFVLKDQLREKCYGYRINYPADELIQTAHPMTVSIGKGQGGYVFWEQYPKSATNTDREYYQGVKKVCFVRYDKDFNLSDVYSFNGDLPDCKPCYYNGNIVWYATEHEERDNTGIVPSVYSINVNTGEVTKKKIGGKNTCLSVSKEESRTRDLLDFSDLSQTKKTVAITDISIVERLKRTCDTLKQMPEAYSTVFQEYHDYSNAIYDGSGRLIRMEYYDDDIDMSLLAEEKYLYDSSGNLVEVNFENYENGEKKAVKYYPGTSTVSGKWSESPEEYTPPHLKNVVSRISTIEEEFSVEGVITKSVTSDCYYDANGLLWEESTQTKDYYDTGWERRWDWLTRSREDGTEELDQRLYYKAMGYCLGCEIEKKRPFGSDDEWLITRERWNREDGTLAYQYTCDFDTGRKFYEYWKYDGSIVWYAIDDFGKVVRGGYDPDGREISSIDYGDEASFVPDPIEGIGQIEGYNSI